MGQPEIDDNQMLINRVSNINLPLNNGLTHKPMLTAVILDDEIRGSKLLQQKLLPFEDQLKVVAVFNHPNHALTEINAVKPDVLFLDVDMPGMNGFEFLEQLGPFNFEVIFSTAYDTFTLEALRLNAIDYLLKPVDEDELKSAINRLQKRVSEKTRLTANKEIRSSTNTRLSLSTAEGIYFVDKSSILRIEAMSNYCTFLLLDNKKIVISKTLKEYENILNENNFLRVNRSTIVNLDYVTKYRKGDGGTLEMTDGKEIEVSAQKKDELLLRML